MGLDTRVLDGIRALLNLQILLFHLLFVSMYQLPVEEITASFAKVPRVIEHGYIGVDGFFTLTGFLLAWPLLKPAPPAKAAAGGAAAPAKEAGGLTYLARRFLRIHLPLLVLIILHCGVVNRVGSYRLCTVRLWPAAEMFALFFKGKEWADNGCSTIGANLVHLQALLPYNGALMHSWSVSVQVLMYIWLPIAWRKLRLGEGARLPTFAAVTTVASLAIRVAAQYHSSFFKEGSILGGVMELFWYSSFFTRFNVIVLGAVAAWVAARHGEAIAAWRPRRLTLLFAWLAIAAWFYVAFSWKGWFGDYRFERGPLLTLYVIVFNVGTPLSGVVWSFLLLSALFKLGPFEGLLWFTKGSSSAGAEASGSLLYRLCASHPLSILAELSYWAYLIHPMIFSKMFSEPWLLLPPSAVDNAPWELVAPATAGIPGRIGNHTVNVDYSVPAGSLFAPLLHRWFELRQWLLPAGAPLSGFGYFFYAVVGVGLTYAASWALYAGVEKPAKALLERPGAARVVNKVAAVHGAFVQWVTPTLLALATVGVALFLRPVHEDAIKGLLTQPNAEVAAEAAAATAVGDHGGEL